MSTKNGIPVYVPVPKVKKVSPPKIMAEEPPLRNEKPWVYCGRCGGVMVWQERGGKVYDRATGREGKAWVWSCARWVRAAGQDHDRHDRPVLEPLDA